MVEKLSLPSLIGRNKLYWQLSKRQWELTRINKGQKEKGISYVNFLALYFTSVQSRFSGIKFPAIFRCSHCDLCWWNGYCHTARQKLCEGSFIWKRKKEKSIFLGVYLNVCLFKRYFLYQCFLLDGPILKSERISLKPCTIHWSKDFPSFNNKRVLYQLYNPEGQREKRTSGVWGQCM